MKKIVKCIIKDPRTEDLLLLRRSWFDTQAGQWEFAGGGVDDGEGVAEACIREVKEETNLDVEVTLHKVETLTCDETDRDFEVYWFIANEVKGKVIIDEEEHCDYEWIDSNDTSLIEEYELDSWCYNFLYN